MADQQQEPLSLASTFPNPPPFWKDFTPENVARIEDLRKAHAENHDKEEGETPARIPDVPEDLLNLQPPAEPKDGRWRVFGDHYMLNDQLPTLEEQGITNLPPTHPSRLQAAEDTTAAPNDGTHYDRALELKRLVKSLLLNFLELTGTLGSNPSHAAGKIEDLRTLLINIHHALNEYRPHQARESAAEMMQDHLDRIRRETVAVRSQVDRARRVLEGLGSLTVPAEEEAKAAGDPFGGKVEVQPDWEAMRVEREREVWKAADALLASS